MDVINGLRRTKHRAYRALWAVRRVLMGWTEPAARAWNARFPYVYNPDDFAHTFLMHDVPLARQTTEPVPRRIFTFWTGENAMSADRQRGLDSLRRLNSDLEFLLITPDVLADWILPDHALHPAYPLLHYVHRADYLRCYFLHFHGGGYADIKTFRTPWRAAFDRMDATEHWMTGYRNPVRWMTPNFADESLQRIMIKTSERRLGQAAYLARPQTPITAEWWRELNLILDEKADTLAAHPGDARGSDPEYPIAWNGILAQILDPLTVKYSDHLGYDDSLRYATDEPYM